jgi:hypothetical protein
MDQYTIQDVKEMLQDYRRQQLEARYPGWARMSATEKVRAMAEAHRRAVVPQLPDVLGEVVRIQRERGLR